MKLINKLVFGFLAISIISLASCVKGDDEGPSKNSAPKGNLTGQFFEQGAQAVSTWQSQSVSAVHDTSFFGSNVRITATNATGDVITILLGDTALGLYTLFQNTTGFSTYKKVGVDIPATTRSNDVQQDSEPGDSKIQITDNGMSDGVLKGTLHILRWYNVGEDNDDDTKFATFSEGSFEAPMSRTGSVAADLELSATIDGNAFNPSSISSSGLSIFGVGSPFSLAIQIPNNASVGVHDISEPGYIVSLSEGTALFQANGTITIDSFDGVGSATGTFEFTATPNAGGDDVTVTDGVFAF